MKNSKTTIVVNEVEIIVEQGFYGNEDYISLTDMTKSFEGGSDLIETTIYRRK